jgi:SRSO17 transposase
VSEQAWSYLQGLLTLEKGKGNMERMDEQAESLPYHQYQHFLTNSPWSAKDLIAQLGQDAGVVMAIEKEKSDKPTGLIVDESSHLKKGVHSVGVTRQYAGTIGKVDNCQVGVYASLCNGKRATLIDERLFLPKDWVEDIERCEKAGIPLEDVVSKTKPALALEMVDNAIANNISFDWVGGDGLYGHNHGLCAGLDERHLLFVLDIHKDQRIFIEKPRILIPEKKSGRGRAPSLYKVSETDIAQRIDKFSESLDQSDWKKVKIRKTTKGWLSAWIYCKEVWVWNGEESEARKRTVIIRKTIGKQGEIVDTKYSFSNGTQKEHTREDFAFFQAQRYWVERNFDDGKNELGMSDYQVRKWKGWHHHHAIVLMAMLFMLKEQIDKEVDYPLMSLPDARRMVMVLIAQSIVAPQSPVKQEIKRMKKRHSKRKKSTDWHFKNGSK